MQVKLTAREAQALTVKPTDNLEAYDAYLRGLVFDARTAYSNAEQRKAIDAYERAVQLDPAFALAWARLSRVHVHFTSFARTKPRLDAMLRDEL